MKYTIVVDIEDGKNIISPDFDLSLMESEVADAIHLIVDKVTPGDGYLGFVTATITKGD